jgi:hypothetical protein
MALRDTQQKYDDIYVQFIKERAELEAKYQEVFSEWLMLLGLLLMMLPQQASLCACWRIQQQQGRQQQRTSRHQLLAEALQLFPLLTPYSHTGRSHAAPRPHATPALMAPAAQALMLPPAPPRHLHRPCGGRARRHRGRHRQRAYL